MTRRRVWRTGEEVAAAVRLSRQGADAETVAQATGIPSQTIRSWQRGRVPLRALRVLAGVPTCAACGEPPHEPSQLDCGAYSYLLGMYLGDGCVYRHSQGTPVLRLFLDAAYPGIVDSARQAIAGVKGACFRTRRSNAVAAASSSRRIGDRGRA
jgi:hypothetical protein